MKLSLFALVLAIAGTVVAGETLDFIANPKITDEFIQQYIELSPEAMEDKVEHPKLTRFHYLGVFEASVAAERWKLVCWMLKTYPDIDADKPLGTLDNRTVLGYAIEKGVFVADDILELRPNAAPFFSWDFVNVYQIIEDPYLHTAAYLKNWPLFSKWLVSRNKDFSGYPIAPNTYVYGVNHGTTGIQKKSILGLLADNNQPALFLDVHLQRFPLNALTNTIVIPGDFKLAVIEEALRRGLSGLSLLGQSL